MTPRVQQVRNWAAERHAETNHKYDGQSYYVHLEMVWKMANLYEKLLPKDKRELAQCAAWAHDTIEDTRVTFNDVAKACGNDVAEIVYALTNEKGKTRKERANAKYYEGIRETGDVAVFVKLCDRLANIRYSTQWGSSMKHAYAKEHHQFKSELFTEAFEPMFDDMSNMLFTK